MHNRNCTFYNISPERSFFYEHIPSIWLSQDPSTHKTIHRLCNLMRKMNSASLVQERLCEHEEIVFKEVEALRKYFNEKIKFEIYRLSFFECNAKNQEELENNFAVSTSIVINFKVETEKNWHSYIFQSFVSLPSLTVKASGEGGRIFRLKLLNNYIHNNKEFLFDIKFEENRKKTFAILGTFFSQQNNFTSVCSHVAICMAINNFNQRHKVEIDEKYRGRILSPEDINEILSIDHVVQKIKVNKSITSKDLEKVLDKFGCEIYCVNYTGEGACKEKYSHHVYRYTESQCPSLLIFSTKDDEKEDIKDQGIQHIVPLLGHTLNTDLWKPEAEIAYEKFAGRVSYKSASSWVDHFVIHDDNFGMYCCLPVDSLWKTTPINEDPFFRILVTISIIPKKINVPAQVAELVNMAILQMATENITDKNNPWIKEILSSLKKKKKQDFKRPLVARTFLAWKDDYIDHLSLADFNGDTLTRKEILCMSKNLPEMFWLTEVSLPDLYTTNKTKLVDVIFPANIEGFVLEHTENITKLVHDNYFKARFPGYIVERKNNKKLIQYPISTRSHVHLLRHKDECNPLEW